MANPNHDVSRLLAVIVEHLDVPPSYYEKAAARHRSLGEWLCRKESKIAVFGPDIRPQGSFRFGTVNRPIREGEEYDLDNVCLLTKLDKSLLTQQELKELYGAEIKAYANANNMIAPVTEHNRCWRLHYADEVDFHLDTLPCAPEADDVVRRILSLGVPLDLARRMVAITDKRHPNYRKHSFIWHSSNPRGFAAWFEGRAALGRVRSFAEGKARAAVEDVPPYEWKTALQRSIQILKRHRDVMFLKMPDLAPISMIITNLAARAYEGELDLHQALLAIVEKIPSFVRTTAPRVPNPADPLEDYADKWSKDSRLEKSFWDWHTAVKTDLAKLSFLLQRATLKSGIQELFGVDLTQEEVRQFGLRPPAPAIIHKAAPIISVASGPRPWGSDV